MSQESTTRNTSVIWLLMGILFTNIGNAVHILTLAKWTYDLTGSSKVFGGALAFEQLAGFGMGIIAGPIVDRLSPIKAVVWIDLIRGVLVTIVGLLTLYFPSIGLVYWMILAIQMGKPFYKSGLFALEIHLVPETIRTNYNARTVSFMQIGALSGVWLAGFLISRSEVQWGFVINGISFIGSAISLSIAERINGDDILITTTSEFDRGLKPYWLKATQVIFEEWASAFRLLNKKKDLAVAIILNSFDTALPQIFNVLLIPLVALKLKNEVFWISGLDSSFSIGAGIAGFAIGGWINKNGIRFGVCLGLGLQAISLILLWFFDHSLFIAISCACFGIFNTISWTSWQTWLQRQLSREDRGKVAILRHMSNSALTALCVLIAGFLAIKGTHLIIVFAALCAFCAFSGSLLFFREGSVNSLRVKRGIN